MRARDRAPRAFSLVEVMVASTLFLVTVVGVVSATSTANAAYEHQRRLTQAVAVGEYSLEELLLRYTTSPDLALNEIQDASGLITAATPYLRCYRADLKSVSTCTTKSMPTQAGMATGLSPVVSVGGSNTYGISWIVGRPPNLNNLRHIRLFVVWQEVGGLKILELQTYRP